MTSIERESCDAFYFAFKDDRPSLELISCASLFCLIAIIGIIFNLLLIFITVVSKSLRAPVNLLLALNSLFEILHQSGHFLFVFTAFSGINFINYHLAIYLSTPALFGLFGLNLTMLFIGLDRFISVVFPIFHRRLDSYTLHYFATLSLICAAFSGFLTYLFCINADDLSDLMTTGTLGALLKGAAGSFYISYALLANFVTIGIYMATGVVLYARSASAASSADQFGHRIFRSLAAIVSVNVGGYFAMALFLFFVFPQFEHSFPVQIWFVRTLLGVFLLNVSAASNGPILYWTSTEYRKAFRAEMAKLGKLFKRNNQIQTIGPDRRVMANNDKINPLTSINNLISGLSS